MEEDRMFAKLKESVQNERMEIDLNKKKEDTLSNDIAEHVQRKEIATLDRRQATDKDYRRITSEAVCTEESFRCYPRQS